MQTYAIGDIHGERELLEDMLKLIADDAGGQDHRIITLGDYADRGWDSKGVFDLLMTRPEIITLRGNHEELLLNALTQSKHDLYLFYRNGGKATIRSFGGNDVSAIPAAYTDWIREKTLFYYEDDLRQYVHAGIHPSAKHAKDNTTHDLVWIREPFLSWQPPYAKYVVHGHTVVHSGKPDAHEPEVRQNRCNLDAGAFHTGVLTCGVFDTTQQKPVRLLKAGTLRR